MRETHLRYTALRINAQLVRLLTIRRSHRCTKNVPDWNVIILMLSHCEILCNQQVCCGVCVSDKLKDKN